MYMYEQELYACISDGQGRATPSRRRTRLALAHTDRAPSSSSSDSPIPFIPMSDGGGGEEGQRQCRRPRGIVVTPDVELGAALALADMAAAAGSSSAAQAQAHQARLHTAEEQMTDEEEMASTRLSLQLGRVGFQQSPSCSSSSSAGGRPSAPGPPAPSAAPPPVAASAANHGPRPRHMLTEAEKEAKRLRRVLANRESARQTILRRQAVRDELARKVADLSSQNETMKKEKDVVLKEYLSLKEANEQLKAQAHHLSLSLF